MRKVNKNYRIRPLSLEPARAPYINALRIVRVTGKWSDKATSLYSANPIKRALETIYHGKCAYCELKPLGSPPQVEHFRPKDGVIGIPHTGYYWLAYEWSNLLLACANCNSRKGNLFPISNIPNRVMVPTIENGAISERCNFISNAPLQHEGFVLLNPEIDQPQKHLAYASSGKLLHLTDRGEVSIDKYDLNRDELYTSGRKRIIDSLYEKLFDRLNRYVNQTRSAALVLEDLVDIIKENIIGPIVTEEAFTSFLKTILLNFDLYIIDRFPDPKIRLILKTAYKRAIQ